MIGAPRQTRSTPDSVKARQPLRLPGSGRPIARNAVPGVVDPDMDRGERPFAWFKYFLSEGGCVVIDERLGVGLWPAGVQHDDALFCETAVTGEFGLDDVSTGS
ncbi:hypothetical protein [Streptomyces pseudovenezuelae]|uniref:Uncharacterized protein n=1 Tax=Streptomyces pseudovenezuelae TaxID=67350 RepID=A0ABT6LZW8_9ACTN|nr:hypothetical protein [Streptomyces pseudovenezuelae]MDH6221858.1 hypothetical protein [Streptomyces pseudovenezuelae]